GHPISTTSRILAFIFGNPRIVSASRTFVSTKFTWCRVAWATLTQVVSALRFFYRVTLGRKDLPGRIAYARRPKTLPVILSPEEVAAFLEAVPSRGIVSRSQPPMPPACVPARSWGCLVIRVANRTFTWKDYSEGSRIKLMSHATSETIRRMAVNRVLQGETPSAVMKSYEVEE